MTAPIKVVQDIEPMVDAKQAAAALCFPYYWFSDHAMRTKYRIPHYLMGGLVRYRLSELSVWAAERASSQSRPFERTCSESRPLKDEDNTTGEAP